MCDRRTIQTDNFGVSKALASTSYCQRLASLCMVVAVFWQGLLLPLTASESPQKSKKQATTEEANEGGSFVRWQAENTLNGKNGAFENPDGDAYANLLEFIIGQPADSGLISEAGIVPRLIYDQARAKFDFEYQRRRDLPTHVKITFLMTGSEGDERPTSLIPTVSATEQGFEKVVYSDVESDPIFQSQTMGKVRLQVTFEDEMDRHQDAKSPLWCWRRQSIAVGGSRSFAMPLLRQEVYRGCVAGVASSLLKMDGLLGPGEDFSSRLSSGESYYVEVTDGVLEGQRWEVDEPACTAAGIALDLTSPRNTQAELPDLTGMNLAVRPHQTLASVVRTDRLLSATQFTQADRVQFWDWQQNRYREYWLALRAGNIRQWVQSGDPAFVDAGSTVLAPDEGLFIKLGSVSASLPLVGLCRGNDLIIGLQSGTNFVGTGWTGSATPEQLTKMNKRAFNASSISREADRFRIWNNQGRVGSPLAGYYLKASDEGPSDWVLEGDTDMICQNQAGLFNGFEAFFFIHRGAPVQWRQPDESSPNASLY